MEYRIDAKELAYALANAALFAGSSKEPPILQSVALYATEHHLVAAATDGYGLAISRVSMADAPDNEGSMIDIGENLTKPFAVIDAATVKLWTTELKRTPHLMTLVVGEGTLTARHINGERITRLLDGEYPRISQLFNASPAEVGTFGFNPLQLARFAKVRDHRGKAITAITDGGVQMAFNGATRPAHCVLGSDFLALLMPVRRS